MKAFIGKRQLACFTGDIVETEFGTAPEGFIAARVDGKVYVLNHRFTGVYGEDGWAMDTEAQIECMKDKIAAAGEVDLRRWVEITEDDMLHDIASDALDYEWSRFSDEMLDKYLEGKENPWGLPIHG